MKNHVILLLLSLIVFSSNAIDFESSRTYNKLENDLNINLTKPDIDISTWYCIGPFKSEEFGNIDRTLNYKFQPEQDYFKSLKARNSEISPIDLDSIYSMKPFPGYLDLERNWTKKDNWTDGFYNLLPRGPAPSRNEAVYMYRAIRSEKDQKITIYTRMQDFYKIWLNSTLVKRFNHLTQNTRYNYPVKMELNLKAGINHVLIKNVSRWAEHDFSFGIEGIHQINDNYYIDVNRISIENAKDAEDYIRRFKFSATPIPMHSPAKYTLDDELKRFDATLGAKQYIKKIKRITNRIIRATAKN